MIELWIGLKLLQVSELCDEQIHKFLPLYSAAHAAIAYISSNHNITKHSNQTALCKAGLKSSRSSYSFTVMHCCLLVCQCSGLLQWQQLSQRADHVRQQDTLQYPARHWSRALRH